MGWVQWSDQELDNHGQWHRSQGGRRIVWIWIRTWKVAPQQRKEVKTRQWLWLVYDQQEMVARGAVQRSYLEISTSNIWSHWQRLNNWTHIFPGWFADKWSSIQTRRRGEATWATQTGTFLLSPCLLAGRSSPVNSLLHIRDRHQVLPEEWEIVNFKTIFSALHTELYVV